MCFMFLSILLINLSWMARVRLGPVQNDRFFLVDQPCLDIVSISLIGCLFRPRECPMLILTYLKMISKYGYPYMDMHIHICICIYAYSYTHIHICISIYAYAYMHIHICISIYVYPYMHIHICISVHVYARDYTSI